MDASELHARRLIAKEVLTPQRSGNFIFPVADGTVKIFGIEHRLTTSTVTRVRPEQGEEQEIFQGKSDELDSPTQLQFDSTRYDEEAQDDERKLKMTSGRSQENSFIVITLYSKSNCTCRKNISVARLETRVCFRITRLMNNQIKKSRKRVTSQKEEKAMTRMLWLF